MPNRISPLRALAPSAIVAGALALVAPSAGAQTEAGVARDARTKAPLECLHVSLVDTAGTALVHGVTDAMGRFSLDAPRAGVYRVRFETYGWDPLVGPLDTLETGAFRQRAYPVEFTSMPTPGLQLDAATLASLPQNQRLDRRAIDSLARTSRRLDEQLRALEEKSDWKSRRLLTRRVALEYPEGLRERDVEGSVIVRFIVDSTGRARAETFTVVETAHEDFGRALRSLLGARWRPSTIAGRPTCDLVQHYVRFNIDESDPTVPATRIWIVNE